MYKMKTKNFFEIPTGGNPLEHAEKFFDAAEYSKNGIPASMDDKTSTWTIDGRYMAY